MKYIRTKDGRIIDLTSKEVSSYEIIDDKTAVNEYGEDSGFICVYYFNSYIGQYIEHDNKGGHSMDSWYLKDILKQADTIEELFMPNDMLVVGNSKNQMPIFIESIEYLKCWLPCHDIYKIKEFYIKVGNDWHLVAKMNNKGDLELWKD